MEEDSRRKQKYIRTKSLIDDHNAAYKQGKVSYEMEANQWTDQVSIPVSLLSSVKELKPVT
jgi:hypothetical protein